MQLPHAVGLCSLGAGMAAFLAGQWKKCTKLCDEAAGIFRDQCTGATWELASARSFGLGGLLYQGELAEIGRRLAVLLPDARECGNLHTVTEVQTRYNITWLAAGDPDAARREVAHATEHWSHRAFHRQHYNALLASAQIDLYLGRAQAARELIDTLWKALAGSLLLRVQVLRVEAYFLRARALLAVVPPGGDRRRLLAMASADARRIAKESMFWSDPLAGLIRAAIAHLDGRLDEAVGELARAVDEFDLAGMGLHASAARLALGTIKGGDEGRQLASEARLWMQTQKILDPDAIARMLAPGLGIGAER